ncbi:MAG: ATP-binding cassette domain-containing protein [Qingshengfaniella sp.]
MIWANVTGGLVLAALAVFGIVTGNGYQLFVLSLMGLTAIVAIGLNILVGMTGQISLGHVGFYAIGAYTVGILTATHGWSFWAALPLGAALAGLAGAVLSIPALRVRGPYLAMITIAFGFIVEQGAAEMQGLTGGWNGLMGIAPPRLAGASLRPAGMAWLILALVVAVTLFYVLFSRSAWGQSLRALRDSEVAAQSIGLNPVLLRCVAFTVSAVLAGLAGGLYAPLSGFISPESFPFFDSILFLLVVMIGGADTILGPLIGAAIVVLLPEAFSALAEYRLLFVGILLLVVLRIAPGGVVGGAATLWARLKPARADASLAPDLARTGGSLYQPQPMALKVSNLAITFGGVKAVQDVSFTARPGQITSIIGPNGAGKTTVLNLIVGIYRPDAGEVRLSETRLDGMARYRIARAGIGRTYQTTQLFEHMSVLDNILLPMTGGRAGPADLVAPLARAARRDKALALLGFAGFAGNPQTRAGALAHVDKRLVEIARALAFEPSVLLLDEPAAGLNEEDTSRLKIVLERIAAAGIAVVLIEHDMDLVMGLSDHIVVLDSGRLIASGQPEDVRTDPAVLAAYLGERQDQAEPRDTPRPPDREIVLTTRDLRCSYGASPVLQGLDLSVGRGELVAVLGANGAGKTTLMRALSGLHRPVSGQILLEGRDVADLPADRLARLALALVPEGRQVFGDLTVIQNIRLGAFGRPPADLDAEVERLLHRFPRLRERAGQRAGLLSGGEQQMLAIARGLVSNPHVLLLDEPSLGLAPAIIRDLYDGLAALRDDGATILLVDQMADMALSIADQAYVLSNGQFSASGTAAQVHGSHQLDDAYLGAAAQT